MSRAYINQIETAVPDHDVHEKFVDYAPSLLSQEHDRRLFKRMAQKAGIEHRYSFLKPHLDESHLDVDGFYQRGMFPNTEARMRFYERHAFSLAKSALDKMHFAERKDEITHLVITTCTGFYAPGIDLQILEHYGLKSSVERTVIGFMGCSASLNALKTARHIIRSEPSAAVVILNLELCTVHMQEKNDLQNILPFLLFADGCAASLVSAKPVGIEIQSFASAVLSKSTDQITWRIGDFGFDMTLSGQVPLTIAKELSSRISDILDGKGTSDAEYWAVHPGGRAILDAVQKSIDLSDAMLRPSREVLRRYGNMSSATVMFVLKEMLQSATASGKGCGIAFGPGLTMESMLFQIVSDI